jgi:hypothetical protein
VQSRQRTAKLHEATALAQCSQVDRREAEPLGKCGYAGFGLGVVAGDEQQLTARLVVGVGGDAFAEEGVERLDDAGAGQQGGDVFAAGETTEVGDLPVRWWAGDLDNPAGVLEAAKSARAAAPGPEPLRVVDVPLDAFALRLTEGYTAAVPSLTRALELALAPSCADDNRRLWLTGGRAGAIVALELWDAESAHTLAVRLVQIARDSGAVARLQFALNTLAWTHLVASELTAAALMIDEDRVIAPSKPPSS